MVHSPGDQRQNNAQVSERKIECDFSLHPLIDCQENIQYYRGPQVTGRKKSDISR